MDVRGALLRSTMQRSDRFEEDARCIPHATVHQSLPGTIMEINQFMEMYYQKYFFKD